MTAPTITMELFLGGSWVDIASSAQGNKVQLAAGITVTRGRNNEASDPDPGTLVFTVDNSDGRFTIGNTAGVYGANFKKWVPVRYTANGVRRFTGYVRKAPTKWSKGSRKVADNTITCVDVIGLMAMSPVVRSWAESLIGALSPLYWWKMDDADGSTFAAEANGGMRLNATLTAGADTVDDHLKFGTEGPATLEASTQLTFTNDASLAWRMQSSGAVAGLGTTFSVLMIYTPSKDMPWSHSSSSDGIFTLATGTNALNVVQSGIDGLLTACTFLSGVTDSFNSNGPVARPVKGVPILLAVNITPTTIELIGGQNGAVSRLHSGVFNGSTVTIAPGSNPQAGTISHFAIVNRAITLSEYNALSLNLFGGPGPVVDWINRAASEAGYATSATATYNRTMERPILKGSNPAELGNTLAAAADAVFIADRLGVPKWLDSSYCPARVDLDSADFLTDLLWDDDESLFYTEVQVDGVKRATANVDQFPRKEKNLEGLLLDFDLTNLVTWFANTGDVWAGSRMSGIAVNLWPMDSTKTGVYLGLDIKSRIYPTGTPSQIPTPSVQTVEGYTDTVTDKDWTLAFSTAPDPSFVLEDDIAGVVESEYRLGH